MIVKPDTASALIGNSSAVTAYLDALRDPQSAFQRPDLQRAVFDQGAFGVDLEQGEHVFVGRATIDGCAVAIRCHFANDPHLEARYRIVDEHLRSLGSNVPKSICRAEYVAQGVLVAGVWRPITIMPWVDGLSLLDFVEDHVKDSGALAKVAADWLVVAKELRDAQYVHGDLSHVNVRVAKEGIRLIDPDVAWVPALGNALPNEKGLPSFQHPKRPGTASSLELDNFSQIVIYLSLRALASDPSLISFSDGESLFLKASDYSRPHHSKALAQMLKSPDVAVRTMTAKLMKLCLGAIEEVPALEEFVKVQPAPVSQDGFEREAATKGTFVLPPNSRRVEWLDAFLEENGP